MLCVIFDMDGTLVNSSEFKKELWMSYLKRRGHSPYKAKKEYEKYNGRPRRELLDSILTSLGESAMDDAGYEEFNRYLSSGFNPLKVALFPDSLPALEMLFKRGYKLFVSSGAPQSEVDNLIGRFGLHGFFKQVYGSDGNFIKGRPHFDEIVRLTSAKKKELVFIGNDMMDSKISSEFGINSLLVDRDGGGGPKTDLVDIAERLVMENISSSN